MSEHDLELKLRVGRWFWSLGSSTLLRVRLTSFEAKPKKGKPELSDLADLDVLGTEVAPDFRLRYRAAECKSGRAGAKELFWLRGVLDYYGADEGYLVVQHDDVRRPGLRELASRLDLGILTFNDFEALNATYPDSDAAAADLLYDAELLAEVDKLLANPPKKLERLTDYTMRFYWQTPQHRNLQLVVANLHEASATLDPRHSSHRLLFAEAVYRYCLSLFAACEAIVKRGYGDMASQLPVYLHGGELGLREANQRLRSLREVQKALEGEERLELSRAFSETPPYHAALLDVTERLLRRPTLATAMLRHLQVAMHVGIPTDRPAFELLASFDPIAAKLVNDVAAFLVRAAGLEEGHRVALDEALNGSPAGTGGPSGPNGNAADRSKTAAAEQMSIANPSE
jgi:hypothetical protein